jgi:dipeptidyl aminopeptidase/acylaminoacyl peptidase
LDHRGMIDRTRVGIVGFSGTVYDVGYTLTHSTFPFSAAVLVDGVDGGYLQYLVYPWVADQFNAYNGGPPFSNGLNAWLKNSPGFNMDKVRTPVRLVAHSRASILASWEWFSGLSLLHKPVELVELPDASHILERPWDRRIAQQGILDWFCFWLKGQEDPQPAKVSQYRRWRELRKLDPRNRGVSIN